MKKSLIVMILLANIIGLSSSCQIEEKFKSKCNCSKDQQATLRSAKLFVELPDYAPTPDAMVIAPNGDLILSCPNFADTTKTGCLIRISKNRKITKIANTPVLESTKKAHFMGMTFDDQGYLYVCDNQGWTGTKEGQNQGRLLRLKLDGNNVVSSEVVAYGMSHPNGVRFHNGYLFVTQSMLPKIKTNKLTSGIYKFKTSDRNIKINNDNSDKNLIFTSKTQNAKCQYGLDGLVFDKKGNLYVGDFGDGTIFKLIMDKKCNVKKMQIFTVCPNDAGIDGMDFDDKDNLYVTAFSKNEIFKINSKGRILTIAKYPDNDGSNGQIDQGADVIVYGNKLIISNFDCVTDAGKVNRKHDKPYTLSYLDI